MTRENSSPDVDTPTPDLHPDPHNQGSHMPEQMFKFRYEHRARGDHCFSVDGEEWFKGGSAEKCLRYHFAHPGLMELETPIPLPTVQTNVQQGTFKTQQEWDALECAAFIRGYNAGAEVQESLKNSFSDKVEEAPKSDRGGYLWPEWANLARHHLNQNRKCYLDVGAQMWKYNLDGRWEVCDLDHGMVEATVQPEPEAALEVRQCRNTSPHAPHTGTDRQHGIHGKDTWRCPGITEPLQEMQCHRKSAHDAHKWFNQDDFFVTNPTNEMLNQLTGTPVYLCKGRKAHAGTMIGKQG